MTSLPYLYSDMVTGSGKKIFERFKTKFGHYPNAMSQAGYAYADVVVEGLKNAGRNLTTDSLLSGLESIKNHPHPFKKEFLIGFSPTKHQGSNESVLYQVKNKRWVSPVPGKMISLTY